MSTTNINTNQRARRIRTATTIRNLTNGKPGGLADNRKKRGDRGRRALVGIGRP